MSQLRNFKMDRQEADPSKKPWRDWRLNLQKQKHAFPRCSSSHRTVWVWLVHFGWKGFLGRLGGFLSFFGTCRWSCLVWRLHVKSASTVKTSSFARTLILNCGWFISDKTIKLWKISERDKRPEGYNLKEEDGRYRDPTTVTTLRVSSLLSLNWPHSSDFFSPSPRAHRFACGSVSTCPVRLSALHFLWCQLADTFTSRVILRYFNWLGVLKDCDWVPTCL